LERSATLAGAALDSALELDLIRALFVSGQIDAAIERAERAADRATVLGEKNAELALRIEGCFAKTFGDPEGASHDMEALVAEAIPRFEAAGDSLGLCIAYSGKGEVAHMRGKADTAAIAFEAALDHARRAGLHHRVKHLQAWLAAMRLNGSSSFVDVIAYLEEQIRSGEADANLYAFLAFARAGTGQIDEARAELARVLTTLEERGMTLLVAQFKALGYVQLELLAGDPAAAAAWGLAGCRMLEELGERSWLSTAAGQLAQAFYALDRLEDADSWALRARELGASDDMTTQMLWRQVEAKLLARRGDAAEAERLGREAVSLSVDAELIEWTADAYLDLGTVFELVGKTSDARSAFERALELYERKGNVVMSARVRLRVVEQSVA
jgi:tetratricopeptide (TPR) repeat protein